MFYTFWKEGTVVVAQWLTVIVFAVLILSFISSTVDKLASKSESELGYSSGLCVFPIVLVLYVDSVWTCEWRCLLTVEGLEESVGHLSSVVWEDRNGSGTMLRNPDVATMLLRAGLRGGVQVKASLC